MIPIFVSLHDKIRDSANWCYQTARHACCLYPHSGSTSPILFKLQSINGGMVKCTYVTYPTQHIIDRRQSRNPCKQCSFKWWKYKQKIHLKVELVTFQSMTPLINTLTATPCHRSCLDTNQGLSWAWFCSDNPSGVESNFNQICSDYIRQRPKIFPKSVWTIIWVRHL